MKFRRGSSCRVEEYLKRQRLLLINLFPVHYFYFFIDTEYACGQLISQRGISELVIYSSTRQNMINKYINRQSKLILQVICMYSIAVIIHVTFSKLSVGLAEIFYFCRRFSHVHLFILF
jgi:hypothetical protein